MRSILRIVHLICWQFESFDPGLGALKFSVRQSQLRLMDTNGYQRRTPDRRAERRDPRFRDFVMLEKPFDLPIDRPTTRTSARVSEPASVLFRLALHRSRLVLFWFAMPCFVMLCLLGLMLLLLWSLVACFWSNSGS